jgi:hypothetical protein
MHAHVSEGLSQPELTCPNAGRVSRDSTIDASPVRFRMIRIVGTLAAALTAATSALVMAAAPAASSTSSTAARELTAAYARVLNSVKSVNLTSPSMTATQRSELSRAAATYVVDLKKIRWPSSLQSQAGTVISDATIEQNAIKLVPTGSNSGSGVLAALLVVGQSAKTETTAENVLRAKLGLKPQPQSSSSSRRPLPAPRP